MSDKPTPPEKTQQHQPGEGIRSMKSTTMFRAINFELYAKPVSVHRIGHFDKWMYVTLIGRILLESGYHGNWCCMLWNSIRLYYIYAIKIRKSRLLCGSSTGWHRSIHKEALKMGINRWMKQFRKYLLKQIKNTKKKTQLFFFQMISLLVFIIMTWSICSLLNCVV